MGIALPILWIALGVLRVGLDVCLFFLLIRFVLIWRSNGWLERFNDAGRTLVDAIVAKVGALWFRAVQKKLSQRGELLVSFVGLSIVRLVLCEIGKLL